MSGPACVVFDPSLTDYDFGPAHPLAPVRVELTMALAGCASVPDIDRGAVLLSP